jgi:predicted dienelactone hydrolase
MTRQFSLLSSLLSSLLLSGWFASPSGAAQRLSLWFGPLQFSLSVQSLEILAAEGRVTPELSYYTRWLSPAQVQQLRHILQQPLPLSPVLVSQVTYSQLGQAALQSLSPIIGTGPDRSGLYALRAALILAAAQPEGLTLLGGLRQFPAESVWLDGRALLQQGQLIRRAMQERDRAIATLRQQTDQEAVQSPDVPSHWMDLSDPGPLTWQKQEFTIDDARRQRHFQVDFYQPETANRHPLPLVIILPGLAENRISFDYLAQQLASFGFAVALPENPDNSSDRFRRFFEGRAPEPDVGGILSQPQDVTALLDGLHRRSAQGQEPGVRLNLQQVGVMGHSQGGLSALLLAGAPLDKQHLQQQCQTQSVFQLTGLVQCQLAQQHLTLPELADPRVQAVLPISPSLQGWLAPQALAQVSVPVLMVAASHDLVTPAVSNQIQPFMGLRHRDRYLALMEGATHFSPLTNGELHLAGVSLPPSLIGPAPQRVRAYLKALSTAFFQSYIGQQPLYRPYLSAAYARHLSQPALPLHLVRTLSQSW